VRDDESAGDPIKDRFKAALEKKQNASRGSANPAQGGDRAIGPHSTNEKTQQMFRRKSGAS
jgi:hypothetical protein